MPAALLTCPNCSARLQTGSTNGAIRCPRCGATLVLKRPQANVPTARPAAPPPPHPQASPSGPSRGAVLIGLGVAGFLLLAGAAVVVALALSPEKGNTGARADADPPGTAKADADQRPAPPDDRGEPAPGPNPSEPPPLPNTLSEEERQEVNEAIDRGVTFLEQHLPAGAMGNHRYSGLHPLVGLTLLECGVPADDPALRGLTDAVRDGAAGLSETYSLSLAILFLDRLGDPDDEKRIRLMAARLIAGQNAAGGWTYGCPALPESDAEKLLTYLDTNPVPARRGATEESGVPLVIRPPRTPPGRPAALSRDALPASIKGRDVVNFDPDKELPPMGGADDNSNTQFATLGVWTARRHGVATERSMALLTERFRRTQNADGSWGYNMHNSVRRDSMTCAGLLGLAVGRASDGTRDAAEKDPAIAKGLQFLGQKVLKPSGMKPAAQRRPGVLVGADSLGDLYWLWSVERVGVIYSLPTLGGNDWYAWGAEVLVEHQAQDGSWNAGAGPQVDTCFALLFLKRANVAKDLTRQLQVIGRVRDPGAATEKK